MFFTEKRAAKRAAKRAQKKAASEAAAIQKANRIKEIFQHYELLDKPLYVKGWRHNIASDIWILKDVFAVEGGRVMVRFVLPVSNTPISFYWGDFLMKLDDYGTSLDVVTSLFLPAQQRYLALEKEILSIQKGNNPAVS